MGKRRLRLCKDCGRKFTPKNQQYLDYDESTETNQPQQQTCNTEIPPENPATQHDQGEDKDDGHNITSQ